MAQKENCMITVIVFIQGLMLVFGEVNDTTYYVCPFGCGKSSPGLPCETINYYASNSSLQMQYLTLVFQSGTHWLEEDWIITNTSYFTATVSFESAATISCNRSSGIIFKNVHSLTLIGLTISNCSTLFSVNQTAALIFENVFHLILCEISVINSFGYGILAKNVYGNSTISSCRLQNNQGNGFYHGGNMHIMYKNCSSNLTSFMIISNSIFSNGSCSNCNTTYNIALASGLSMILSCTNISVMLDNITIENNSNTLVKGYGGNLFIHFFNDTNFTSNYIHIQNSNILGGSAGIGGGICTVMFTQAVTKERKPKCDNYLTISDSEVTGNSAHTGGGWFIKIIDTTTNSKCPSLSVLAKNTIFKDNSVKPIFDGIVEPGGASIYVVNGYLLDLLYKVKTLRITLCNITIEGSFILDEKITDSKVAAIYFEKFLGKLTLWDVRILNNAMSGIAIIRGRPYFRGKVNISNNTGFSGGGMSLCDSSYLTLMSNTTIVFRNNHAKYGGGLYVEDPCINNYPSCFYQYKNNPVCLNKNSLSDIVRCYGSKIIMTNNTAMYTGSEIFGGSVAKCSFRTLAHPVNSKIFYSVFDVSRNMIGSLSAVSSSPVKVCLCNETRLNCSPREVTHPVEIYPGEMITQSVVLVGQLDGTATGIVSINNSYFIPIIDTTSCKELEFTVNKSFYSNATVSFGISDNEYFAKKDNHYSITEPLRVNFNLKECPIGFEIQNGICDCLNIIKSSYRCYIRNKTIERIDYSWIGYSNISSEIVNPGLIYSKTCPLDYCISYDTNINVSDDGVDSDSQCSPYRTGVLCGMCQRNYSITVGKNKCQDCTKFGIFYALLIFLGILAFHFMIVVLLFALNITITDGTLSGLLFYVNIVNSKPNLFLFNHLKFLTIVTSWLNLDIGFTFCMHSGMDMYTKSWLMSTLPPLTWFIVVFLIWLSRRFERIAVLLGGNAVKVLATLIELSFYQTIQSCITALSFTEVIYSGQNGPIFKRVWLYDGNIGYLEGKHIPLFLMGCLFLLTLLLYTGILLCVQPLKRYSHWYCFRWVNKMKPLIDAYTAPHIIKPKCQFWTGFLLFLRVILSVCFSTHLGERPQNDLAAIIVVSVITIIMAALLGGIYKKLYLNLLNLSFFANLTFLSMASLFHLNKNHHCFGCTTGDTETYFADSSAIVAILTAMLVVLYYVYRRIKTLWSHRVRGYNRLLDVREDRVLHSRSD